MTNEFISQWVSLYTEDMFKWALHKTSSHEISEDLVQDTFMAATEKISSFKGDSTPKTWLFSILNNKIVDYYRKKVKQAVPMEDQVFASVFDASGSWVNNRMPHEWHDSETNLLDDEAFQKVLKHCLDALPEKWNLCVKLKYLTNKNGQEICQELNLTASNFWQIIHRAKLQLRVCIDQNWFNN
ncbi:MAG: sigma-70 family RNA polymerase sigma factor [Bacteroidales bacterium]|nr:sigma-70 family RNA polymerase sigma factor [Bacteroidales bacterium]